MNQAPSEPQSPLPACSSLPACLQGLHSPVSSGAVYTWPSLSGAWYCPAAPTGALHTSGEALSGEQGRTIALSLQQGEESLGGKPPRKQRTWDRRPGLSLQCSLATPLLGLISKPASSWYLPFTGRPAKNAEHTWPCWASNTMLLPCSGTFQSSRWLQDKAHTP